MNPVDLIVGAVILLILGGAVAYLIRAKKKGRKCVGCPYCDSCGTNKKSACNDKKS